MANPTIEEFLPQTAAYINWVYDNNSAERCGHHNHVIIQKIMNHHTPFVELDADELAFADIEFFEYLYRLDDEPSIIEIVGCEEEDHAWVVKFELLGELSEMGVQLAGGEYLQQMGCWLFYNDEAEYYPAETSIIKLVIDDITRAAEKDYKDDCASEMEEGSRDGESWEFLLSRDHHQLSATSSSYIRVDKSNQDRYRVYSDNDGFTQPNDYSQKPEFEKPLYFNTREELDSHLEKESD